MQSETVFRFVFANETGRAHSRIRKFQVFVQIVQTVEKVAHVSSQHGQNSVVTVLTHKTDEEYAHLVEKLFFAHFQYLKNLLFKKN